MIASPTHYICVACDCHMPEYRIHYYTAPVPTMLGEIRFDHDPGSIAHHSFLCAECAPELEALVKS